MLNLVVRKKYFDAIWAGQKTVEARLNSEKYKDLKAGMPIQFTVLDSNRIAICIIETINTYPDFKTMLISEGLENALPGIKTLEEGVKIYEAFPDYKKNVKKTGVLAIKIRMCSAAELRKIKEELTKESL